MSNWRSLYQANRDASNGDWYAIKKVKFNFDEVAAIYPRKIDVVLGVHPGWGFNTVPDKPVLQGTNLTWALRVNPDDASVTMNGEDFVYYDEGSGNYYLCMKGSTVVANKGDDGYVVIDWLEPVYFYGWVTPNQAMMGNYQQFDLGGHENMAELIYVLPDGMDDNWGNEGGGDDGKPSPIDEMNNHFTRILDAKYAICQSIRGKGVGIKDDTPIQDISSFIDDIKLTAAGNLTIALGDGKGQEWDARHTNPFDDTTETLDLSRFSAEYTLLFTCTEEIQNYSLSYKTEYNDGSVVTDEAPFTELLPTTTDNINNGLVNDRVYSNVLMFKFYVDEKPGDVFYRQMVFRIWTDDDSFSRQHNITLLQYI